jgi:DNA-binding NarL/FixJ family response regulator
VSASGHVTADEDRLSGHLDRLARLPDAHRRLRASGNVGELFARGAELACEACGFARGVILSVGEGRLSAGETDALADPASDVLRRRALAEPVELHPGTDEAELNRRCEGTGRARGARASRLAEALDLRAHALGVVAPQSKALALLVLDRDAPACDELDRATVTAFAAMIAVALEHVVLCARISELSHELRYLSSSAQALLAEVLEAPISLPFGGRHGPAFPLVDVAGPLPREGVRDLLSERENDIAALLVEGRTNREIAEQLILSPETVKDYVGRIMRKLGASNRVEAVSRYLRLQSQS